MALTTSGNGSAALPSRGSSCWTRSRACGRSEPQQGYTEDYESLAALHRLANENGIGIPVLHHTRKMEAEDPIDTVCGTLGLAGCADTVLVLNRSSQGTTLYVRGRDIEEAEHAITFDKQSLPVDDPRQCQRGASIE